MIIHAYIIIFGSFLPNLWSLTNQTLLGPRSRHCCYEIKSNLADSRVRLREVTANSTAIAVNGNPEVISSPVGYYR